MTINQRVKFLREKENLTQQAFADSIGMARANLAQLESGKQNPTIAQISSIVKRYRVTYGWLIDGSEDFIHHHVLNEPPLEYDVVHRKNDVVGRFSQLGAELDAELALIKARLDALEKKSPES